MTNVNPARIMHGNISKQMLATLRVRPFIFLASSSAFMGLALQLRGVRQAVWNSRHIVHRQGKGQSFFESAVSRNVKKAALGAIVVATIQVFAFGQAIAQTYLLSATPSNYGTISYPIELYKINDAKHIERVREIAPEAEGLFAVEQAANGDLAILTPPIVPTDVSVIFAKDPSRLLKVHLDNAGSSLLDTSVALVQTGNDANALILPMIVSPPSKARVLVHRQLNLTNDSDDTRRVSNATADAYERLRYAGTEGGPTGSFSLVGRLADGSLSIDGDVVVAIPRSKLLPADVSDVAILGATDRFLLFQAIKDIDSLLSQTSRTVFLYDRLSGKLRTVEQPGNASSVRMAGPWFATTERYLWSSPDDPRIADSPEYAGESEQTRELYLAFTRRVCRTTGRLVLDSLYSDRRVSWFTGQEDSEVLSADADNVIYRVNDGIFTGQMSGTSIENSRLLARGPDVPTVHWLMIKGKRSSE